MNEESYSDPRLPALYRVCYDPADTDYDGDTDSWAVGLGDGAPIAVCFSENDANTVAVALNAGLLAAVSDFDLLTRFEQADGESGIALALRAEIERRRVAP